MATLKQTVITQGLVIFLMAFITSHASAEKISDQRLCADSICETMISKARTLARHKSNDPAFLSFDRGEVVSIYSKSAGSRIDLWGGELKGKRGYFPRSFVREFKVEIPNPGFTVETENHVPVEDRVMGKATQPPKPRREPEVKQAPPPPPPVETKKVSEASDSPDKTEVADETDLDTGDDTEVDDPTETQPPKKQSDEEKMEQRKEMDETEINDDANQDIKQEKADSSPDEEEETEIDDTEVQEEETEVDETELDDEEKEPSAEEMQQDMGKEIKPEMTPETSTSDQTEEDRAKETEDGKSIEVDKEEEKERSVKQGDTEPGNEEVKVPDDTEVGEVDETEIAEDDYGGDSGGSMFSSMFEDKVRDGETKDPEEKDNSKDDNLAGIVSNVAEQTLADDETYPEEEKETDKSSVTNKDNKEADKADADTIMVNEEILGVKENEQLTQEENVLRDKVTEKQEEELNEVVEHPGLSTSAEDNQIEDTKQLLYKSGEYANELEQFPFTSPETVHQQEIGLQEKGKKDDLEPGKRDHTATEGNEIINDQHAESEKNQNEQNIELVQKADLTGSESKEVSDEHTLDSELALVKESKTDDKLDPISTPDVENVERNLKLDNIKQEDYLHTMHADIETLETVAEIKEYVVEDIEYDLQDKNTQIENNSGSPVSIEADLEVPQEKPLHEANVFRSEEINTHRETLVTDDLKEFDTQEDFGSLEDQLFKNTDKPLTETVKAVPDALKDKDQEMENPKNIKQNDELIDQSSPAENEVINEIIDKELDIGDFQEEEKDEDQDSDEVFETIHELPADSAEAVKSAFVKKEDDVVESPPPNSETESNEGGEKVLADAKVQDGKKEYEPNTQVFEEHKEGIQQTETEKQVEQTESESGDISNQQPEIVRASTAEQDKLPNKDELKFVHVDGAGNEVVDNVDEPVDKAADKNVNGMEIGRNTDSGDKTVEHRSAETTVAETESVSQTQIDPTPSQTNDQEPTTVEDTFTNTESKEEVNTINTQIDEQILHSSLKEPTPTSVALEEAVTKATETETLAQTDYVQVDENVVDGTVIPADVTETETPQEKSNNGAGGSVIDGTTFPAEYFGEPVLTTATTENLPPSVNIHPTASLMDQPSSTPADEVQPTSTVVLSSITEELGSQQTTESPTLVETETTVTSEVVTKIDSTASIKEQYLPPTPQVLGTSFGFASPSSDDASTTSIESVNKVIDSESASAENVTVNSDIVREQVQPSLDQGVYMTDKFLSRKPLSTGSPASSETNTQGRSPDYDTQNVKQESEPNGHSQYQEVTTLAPSNNDPYGSDAMLSRKVPNQNLDENVAAAQPSFFQNLDSSLKSMIYMLPPSLQSVLEQEPLGLPPTLTVLVSIVSMCLLLIVTCIGCMCRTEKKSGKQDPLVVIHGLEEQLFIATKEKENLEDELQIKSKKVDELEHAVHNQKHSTGAVETDLNTHRLHNDALKKQVQSFQQEITDYKHEVAEKARDIKAKQETICQYEAELDQQQDRVTDLELALQKTKEGKTEREEELQRSQDQVQSLKQQMEHLETRKQQLDEEALQWSERVKDLTDQLEQSSQEARRMQEDLAFKENELEVLRDCFLQVKAFQGEEEMKEEPDESQDLSEKLKSMMDVSRVNASLRAVEEEKDVLQNKLHIEVESRKEMEDQIQRLKRTIETNQTDKMKAERHSQEAQTRLEVLSKYFKEKETELTRQLGEQEVLKNQNMSKLQSSDSITQELTKENETYKAQIEDLKSEITKAERDFRSQIAANEKKAHENWLATRAAERELKESRHECGMLRQKLTDLERKLMQGPPPGLIRPITQRGIPPPGVMNGPPPPPERPGSRGSVHGHVTPRLRDDDYRSSPGPDRLPPPDRRLPPGMMGPRPPHPSDPLSPPPYGIRPPFPPDRRSPPNFDRYPPPPRGARPPFPRPPPPHLRSPPPLGPPSEHEDSRAGMYRPPPPGMRDRGPSQRHQSQV